MNWTDTRRRLLRLAATRLGADGDDPPAPDGLAPLVASDRPRADWPAPDTSVRATSICVASGKGGTGKSVVTASLARLFAARGPTLIVDADMGVGNAHLLQGVFPQASFVDVVEGRCEVSEVIVPCGGGLDLIAAGSGVPRMAELSTVELTRIASGLAELERRYRFLLVDSAAGIAPQTLTFAQSCDRVVIVTTPDLTAMTDAYAFLKVLFAREPAAQPLVLVNRVAGGEQAREVRERIERVCERFLGAAPKGIGWLPEDPVVSRSGNRRGPVVKLAPNAPVSLALRGVGVRLLGTLTRQGGRGMGRSLLENLAYRSLDTA